jgi:hypothetical protein
MNRQTLLEHIAKDKDVKATCDNICRGVDAKEFYCHVIYKLCEIPEHRLLEIYHNNYLRWYIVRLIMIEWKLRHRNKKQFETIDNIEVINETYNFELDVEVSRVEDNINDLPNFEKRMLLEYIKSGSYRKLSEETNIPYRTIGNHIKRIKDKLK